MKPATSLARKINDRTKNAVQIFKKTSKWLDSHRDFIGHMGSLGGFLYGALTLDNQLGRVVFLVFLSIHIYSISPAQQAVKIENNSRKNRR